MAIWSGAEVVLALMLALVLSAGVAIQSWDVVVLRVKYVPGTKARIPLPGQDTSP